MRLPTARLNLASCVFCAHRKTSQFAGRRIRLLGRTVHVFCAMAANKGPWEAVGGYTSDEVLFVTRNAGYKMQQWWTHVLWRDQP